MYDKQDMEGKFVQMWAFLKIQDGVQDGRQLHGVSKMDFLLQSLGRFWWFLGN